MAADGISKSDHLRRASSDVAEASAADDAGVIVSAAAAVGPALLRSALLLQRQTASCQGRHVGKLRRLFQLAVVPLFAPCLRVRPTGGTIDRNKYAVSIDQAVWI